MGVTHFRGRDGGSWDQGDRDKYLQAEEYGCAVHINIAHSGSVPGYGEEARIAGTKVVVVTQVYVITRKEGGMGGRWIRGWVRCRGQGQRRRKGRGGGRGRLGGGGEGLIREGVGIQEGRHQKLRV